MKADAIVLGAGIVGVSVAIHLAKRGKAVALIDRRDPGEETSAGNAGLIQREAIYPYGFPSDLRKIFRYASNRTADLHYHLTAMPGLALFLARYWWHSKSARHDAIAALYAPLIEHSLIEHGALIEEAGAGDLIRKNGWLIAFRTAKARDLAFREADRLTSDFGVGHEKLSGDDLVRAEPSLRGELSGALHWRDPWSVADPSRLVKAYAALFERLGGSFVKGDAAALSPGTGGNGWRIATASGMIEAEHAVIALGPWADTLTRKLGYRLPLAVKRGYHMHYQPGDDAVLNHWILDSEGGYLLAPMMRGIRLTTGIEFARRDAPQTPVQLARAEAVARRFFPLGERLDERPWIGARPCTPDMMPIIGRAPRHAGLWFGFGHAHHGLTLGPVTGRLLAEQMTGERTFIDPSPYRPERFRI
jgi:D-amino-acid dehydrogenase